MRARRVTGAAAMLLAIFGLGGCEDGLAGGLRRAGVGSAPDEFLVLPTRPLEVPQDLAALPPPTPGAPNRVDYRPHAEAVAGLTGRPGPAGVANGAALVARAGPIDPAIRSRLAAEDAVYRREHPGLLLERVFTRDREALIYRGMALNAPATFEVMRARGVQVPPAPPSVLTE
jgi:hypothetical protein